MNCEYLLDTNVYIQAWALQYPKPVFPGFWDWFQAIHQSGSIRTIDKVVQELKHTSDIYAWVKDNVIQVNTSDVSTTEAYIRVIKTAQSRIFPNRSGYTQNAIAEFGDVADSFLLASASVHNATLVTWEVSNQVSTGRVKIPDIAKMLNIEIIKPHQLLLKLSPRFTWDKTVDSN